MFDIGWTELLVVAVVAIMVVGPKDLPKMLRTVGKTIGNLKRMASDFQGQFDDALKEVELDEVKNLAKGKFDPLEDVKKSTKEYSDDFKKIMDDRDADLKAAAARGEEPHVFSESETGKLRAEKKAKDLALKAEADKKLAESSFETINELPEPVAKKAPERKTVTKKTAVRKTAGKKRATSATKGTPS